MGAAGALSDWPLAVMAMAAMAVFTICGLQELATQEEWTRRNWRETLPRGGATRRILSVR